MVSDTVTFQHPTLDLPTLTTEDGIIHCLQALTIAICADCTHDNCQAQLLAVENLQAIFKAQPPPVGAAPPATAPRVTQQPPTSPPRVIQAAPPASPPMVMQPALRVIARPPPQAVHNPSPHQPIAHCTQSTNTALAAHVVRNSLQSHNSLWSHNSPQLPRYATPRGATTPCGATTPHNSLQGQRPTEPQLPAGQQLPTVPQISAETNPGTPKVDKYISNSKI